MSIGIRLARRDRLAARGERRRGRTYGACEARSRRSDAGWSWLAGIFSPSDQRLTSTELIYDFTPSARWKNTLSIYYNQITDVISLITVPYQNRTTLPDRIELPPLTLLPASQDFGFNFA
ncbi:MAG: hypothetical protein ABIT01_20665 [Thermoanaerobaculia bacterium]